MKELSKRQRIERSLIRFLLRRAKAAGWSVRGIDDGGDELIYPKSESEAMDAVFAVDESRVYFVKKVNGTPVAKSWVFIVLGNDGYDAINDYGMQPLFEAEIMAAVNEYENKLADEVFA